MSLKTSLVLALLCGVVMAAVADPYYYYYYYYGNRLVCPPGATFVTSGTIPCNCFFTYPAGTCCMDCPSGYVCDRVFALTPSPSGGQVVFLESMRCVPTQ